MANVTAGAGFALNMNSLDISNILTRYDDRSVNSTENYDIIRYWDEQGTETDHLENYTVVKGDNFTFDLNLQPTGGTIDTIRVGQGGEIELKFENLTTSLPEFDSYTKMADDPATTGDEGTQAFLRSALIGNDQITGSGLNDVLRGLSGNDKLTGGAGADTFVFETALNATTNVDTITDFSVPEDTIYLDDLFFAGLGTGTSDGTAITDSMFSANLTGKATSAAGVAQITYETDTGKLFYDADGKGGAAGVLFGKVGLNLGLTAADFEII